MLFDLFRGRKNRRPDAEAGYLAARSASSGPIPLGNHGPGVGAVAGGVKGGLGTASLVLEGFAVGALEDCPGYHPPVYQGPPEDYPF